MAPTGLIGLPFFAIDRAVSARLKRAMPLRERITQKLTEAFAPESLLVVDESSRHEGHAGHRPGGETHFRVHIVADAFRGKTRIERHRMINAALSGELVRIVAEETVRATKPAIDLPLPPTKPITARGSRIRRVTA